MADFLLELFSEEIPARMQVDAIGNLARMLKNHLGEFNNEVALYSTPRRLAVWVKNLPLKQVDITTELKGPKIDAPPAALEGFLKKNNLTKNQLENREGVYFANIFQKGRPTAELIKDAVEATLIQFPWPKSMRWGSGETTWVRPLHNILCIFDGKVVPVEFAGLKANNKTFGHRFLAPAEIIISDTKQYEAVLENAFVIADREKRKAIIVQQAGNVASTLNLTPLPDPHLLEEVVGLVEYPAILLGKIDDNFMDLPPEVLTMVMRAHQKYFCLVPSVVEGSEVTSKDPSTPLRSAQDVISPYFIITSNLQSKDGGAAIIEGNQRVLRARFADGRFFWDQDRKKPLAEFAEGLKSVTYHAKLGSIADKVGRVEKLAVILSEAIAKSKDLDPSATLGMTKRAVQLCKADLVSGMVGEFAELQGIMGRYYAIQQGEPQAVADAIRDHYKPQGPNDSVPSAPVSICVALADKLDTLIAMFAIGEKPTGSKDPYALRRAALGVIRIVLENDIRLPLKPLFASIPLREIALHKAHDKLVKKTEAQLQHPEKVGKYLTVNETACEDIPEDAAANLVQSLLEFFTDRLIVQLKERGLRHDVIKAIVANGDDDLVRIVKRAEALQAFLSTEDGKNLLAGYKRAANILSIEEKKDKANYSAVDFTPAIKLEPEEIALTHLSDYQLVEKIGIWVKNEQYAEYMRWLASLRQPVDQFFEKIMVNCEDKNLRANRLRMLAMIKGAMCHIADLSLIEG